MCSSFREAHVECKAIPMEHDDFSSRRFIGAPDKAERPDLSCACAWRITNSAHSEGMHQGLSFLIAPHKNFCGQTVGGIKISFESIYYD
jgi:hypothetical protein